MQEESEKKNKTSLVVGAVILAFAFGVLGWYVLRREGGYSVQTENVSQKGTTTVDIGGVTLELPPGSSATVEPVESTKLPPAPDLNRSVTFPKYFSSEAKNAWQAKFSELKSYLAKNPASYDGWIQAGLDWNMITDYEGARLAWEYATKVSPTSSVAFGNLGFLYGYYLHDNSKAEQNFKISLKNAPQALYLYQQTFEFYRDVLKDPAKARALVADGERVTGNKEFFDKLLSAL